MAEFPVHPDAVSAAWLSELLGARVASVAWTPIGTGQVGDSVRFELEYAGDAQGPATLAGKFPAADQTSRATASTFGLYAKEVNFYRDLAPALEVRVPDVRFSGLSEDGSEFILLFEDLGPARGGDQVAGCSIEDAKQGIRQAAAIHAPSWGRADLLDREWVKPREGHGAQVAALYPQAQALFRERYAETLPREMMRLCDELAELSTSYFTPSDRPAPQCVVHGDFRLDNMLFDINGGSEPIAVLDWQTCTTGRPMTDVGYFLGCGIGDELRRAHEEELLDLYCSEMTRRGVPLAREDIWHEYRLGALHGVSTAVFSAAFVERTERGDANFLSMAMGACALALHHDSLGALKGET